MVRVGMLTTSVSRLAGGLFNSVRYLSAGIDGARVFGAIDGYSDIDIREWGNTNVDLFKVLGPQSFSFMPGLAKAVRQAELDILHLHGIWQYTSLVSSNWSRHGNSTIISPRGMLDSWALSESSRKKKLASLAFERRNLKSAACIHALCESEYISIRSLGLKNPVAIIPNGVDIRFRDCESAFPAWKERIPKQCKVILFLGRLHPKKGIERFLEAFDKANSQEWQLVIAGWGEEGYESKLRQTATALGCKDRVHFVGQCYGMEKHATLKCSDAFVLPSFSEGLPMSVLEAWSFGLPSLITPQCNLPQQHAVQAGILANQSVEGLIEGFNKLSSLSDGELSEMSRKARHLAVHHYDWTKLCRDMAEVYEWLGGGRDRPDFVLLE